MSCSSCSITLLPNAKFCHGCGKPASAASAAPKAASPASSPFSKPSTTTTTTTSTFRSGAGSVSPATKAPLSSAAARQPTFGGQKFVSTQKPATPASPTHSSSTTTTSSASGGLNPSRFGAPVRGPAPTSTATASASAAAEQRAKQEAEQKAKLEAEQKAKQEAEQQRLKQQAEQRAKQEAEQQRAKQEAEQRAKQEAEQKARQQAEQQRAKQEAEQKARQEAEQKARQEAEQKARQEAEQKAKQEAELKAKQEAEHRARLASQSAPSVVVSPMRPAASQPVISRGAAPRAGPSEFRRGGLNAPSASSGAGGNKRHSKIHMDSTEIKESLAGLDVEGIQVRHERPAGAASREAPVSSAVPASTTSASSPTISTTAPAGRGGGLANRFASMMAEKAAAEQAAERQKIRGRRKGATEFVDKQIRMLISILQGKGGSVLFGDLFRETADEMPALAATLAVAQKRGVVGFEGNMLMQGVHDKVKITLLRDEIEDSAVFVSVYGIAPVREVEAPKIESCHSCNKTVYPTERVNASGKTMHKSCFRCCTCNGLLKLAQFAFSGGKFYCDTHFKELFASGGGKYNF